jgi:hypothetical protein
VELLELSVGLHARHVLYEHSIQGEALGQVVGLCPHVITDTQRLSLERTVSLSYWREAVSGFRFDPVEM